MTPIAFTPTLPAAERHLWIPAAAFLCLFALVCAPARAGTSDYPAVPAFGGILFQEPVQVVFAPGETTRAFVVEPPRDASR